MDRETFDTEAEFTEHENPLLHLRRFVHGLCLLIDRGATLPVEEVQAAVEEARLREVLSSLPQGDPFSEVPEEERIWILEGLENAGLTAEEMEAIPFRNGLLWMLDLAVEMLFHGEMP